MSDGIEEIARAFSGHRFEAAYPHLADDVSWTIFGDRELIGTEALRDACEASARYLAEVTTDFTRFRALVGESWVVIDSLAKYTDSQQAVSTVASCDIYDFTNGRISRIASYNVALDSE